MDSLQRGVIVAFVCSLCGLPTLEGSASEVGSAFTMRVSVGDSGQEGNGSSLYASSDGEGTLVAFMSLASNLVNDDDNAFCGGDPRFSPFNCSDIFLRNLRSGETTLVTRAADGSGANGASADVALSGDGRVLAFLSRASNLVEDDTNDISDVFAFYPNLGKIERASVNSAGEEQRNATGSSCSSYCGGVSIDNEGRHVVFDTWSDNLAPSGPAPGQNGDLNRKPDVFVRDLLAGTTERVSVSSLGVEGSDASWQPGQATISADGRYVVFQSIANNLVVGDTNICDPEPPFLPGLSCADVFLRDRQSETTIRISVSATGEQANGSSGLATISADGRFVAFSSAADNLVPEDENQVSDVFVKDVLTGRIERVSVDSFGEEGDGGSWNARINANGRFVAFSSTATNLIDADANDEEPDVFVRDRMRNMTVLASASANGNQGPELSAPSLLIADGRLVLFRSKADGLVPNDLNQESDIFLSNVHLAFLGEVGWPNVDGVDGQSPRASSSSNTLLALLAMTGVALGILENRRRRENA